MYYESLRNHVFIEQGVFSRLKINSYIANSMNNSENLILAICHFLEKMQNLICKLPKRFANCEL